MKGIVFNLLEEVIRREHGEETWDALLEATRLEGAYTSLGNYPDQDLAKFVGAASVALKMPAEEITRWYGRRALPLFAERYPQFFAAHKSARPFLLTLNSIIHPEVRKIYPGADVPDFQFDTSSKEVLVMDYGSKRKLCMFAEGLIEGAAEYFGEAVKIEQPKCMHRGDEKCVLRISLQKLDS
ncbi:MAG: heme NO-binding domain-containing protein [Acidobacteria bacterium]|nr:heme NO-binding domain-containing protein [Acidobacteriota bacterium]